MLFSTYILYLLVYETVGVVHVGVCAVVATSSGEEVGAVFARKFLHPASEVAGVFVAIFGRDSPDAVNLHFRHTSIQFVVGGTRHALVHYGDSAGTIRKGLQKYIHVVVVNWKNRVYIGFPLGNSFFFQNVNK